MLPASKSPLSNFNLLESFSSSTTAFLAAAAMSGNKRVFFDVEASGEKLGRITMEVSLFWERLRWLLMGFPFLWGFF